MKSKSHFSDETLRKILSTLTHDINNCLSPIFLYSDILESKFKGDNKSLKQIESISEKAGEIRDLLDSFRAIYKDDDSAQYLSAPSLIAHFLHILYHFRYQSSIKAAALCDTSLPQITLTQFAKRGLLMDFLFELHQDKKNTNFTLICTHPNLTVIAIVNNIHLMETYHNQCQNQRKPVISINPEDISFILKESDINLKNCPTISIEP